MPPEDQAVASLPTCPCIDGSTAVGSGRGADVRAALAGVLNHGRDLEGFELRHNFRGVGPKQLRLSTRRVEGKSQRALILLELQDVTA